ncbi:MAG: hypothetical protein IPH24_09190 [Crocinitomicaceae bacterium]|jgi:hypothetical protein|nr:hypothetical protein [Crocinitomicaceae bacterium]
MVKRIAIFCFVTLSVISCASQRKIVKNSATSIPACSGNQSNESEVKKLNQPVSIVAIHSIIKGSDTILIHELFCTDSIKFTQAFAEIKVSDICIEEHWQGNTYYAVDISDLGTFENFEVLRTIDSCFDSFDNQIELLLSQMKTISPEYFNARLIFYHKFSLI